MWCSALTDGDVLALPPADRWRWAAFGTYVKEHGERGHIEIHPHNPALAVIFDVPIDDVLGVIKRLPNVLIEEGKSDNGKIAVTIRNWHKFQEDSTTYERVKRLRSKRRGEEKRGEEKRGEGSAAPFSSFEQVVNDQGLRARLAEAYPRINLDTEFRKMRLWLDANPQRAKSNYDRFVTNWFSHIRQEGRHATRIPTPAVADQLERDRLARASAGSVSEGIPPARRTGDSGT